MSGFKYSEEHQKRMKDMIQLKTFLNFLGKKYKKLIASEVADYMNILNTSKITVDISLNFFVKIGIKKNGEVGEIKKI